MAIRLLTWNLQGAGGVDVGGVAATIVAQAPDVVVLQEVARGQARRLARRLATEHVRWTFKHWAVFKRPEGMAILSTHRPQARRSYVLRRAPWWDWRRRVALEADILVDGCTVTFVCVHLSPHDAPERRSHEVAQILRRSRRRPPVIAGDVNDDPDGPACAALLDAGWRDAWVERHGRTGGATNWTAGPRIGRPPTQRLDYIFVPAAWRVIDCTVVDDPLDQLAALSDHLPVVAVVAVEERGDG